MIYTVYSDSNNGHNVIVKIINRVLVYIRLYYVSQVLLVVFGRLGGGIWWIGQNMKFDDSCDYEI